MRLAQLAMLNRLVSDRERLINERAHIRAGRGLVVGFNGLAVDEALLELLRPVVVGELSGRIRAIEADLIGLGVDLS